MSHAEHDFFTATDIEARADAFADLDVGARRERLLGPLLAALGALGLAAVFLFRPGPAGPEAGDAPRAKAPVAAAAAHDEASAPRIEPVVVGRAAARPMRRRLAAPAAVAAAPSDGVMEAQDAPASPVERRAAADLAAAPADEAGSAPPAPAVAAAAAPSPVADVETLDDFEPLPSPWLERKLRAPALAPTSGEAASPAALVAARKALAEGRFEDALAGLEGMAAAAPVDALRGRALFELGRDDDALRVLERAHAADAAHADTLLLLGTVRQAKADRAGARAAYEAFLAAHPLSPHAGDVQGILARM